MLCPSASRAAIEFSFEGRVGSSSIVTAVYPFFMPPDQAGFIIGSVYYYRRMPEKIYYCGMSDTTPRSDQRNHRPRSHHPEIRQAEYQIPADCSQIDPLLNPHP